MILDESVYITNRQEFVYKTALGSTTYIPLAKAAGRLFTAVLSESL